MSTEYPIKPNTRDYGELCDGLAYWTNREHIAMRALGDVRDMEYAKSIDPAAYREYKNVFLQAWNEASDAWARWDEAAQQEWQRAQDFIAKYNIRQAIA